MRPTTLLVEEALDSAHAARDLLNAATVPPRQRGGLLPLLLGVFGASSVAQAKKPPREVVRRTSNALDAFARDLSAAAEAIGDVGLIGVAAEASTWGTELWDEKVSAHDLQPRMSAAEGELIQHRMLLIRNRPHDVD